MPHAAPSQNNNVFDTVKKVRYGKVISVQTISDQEGGAPRFPDNWQVKVVRLAALRTGRFYPPGNISGTLFC